MMKNPSSQEKVHLWHMPQLGHVDLMHAHYVTRRFPRHTHDGFGVGVIEQGALGFYYRGENVVASPGGINLVNPGEVHTGHAATQKGWTYRMFYFDAPVLQRAASEMVGKNTDIPFFQQGVLDDKVLARQIHALHVTIEKGTAPLLEIESRFLFVLTQLIARHADTPHRLKAIGREHVSVARAREFIAAHFDENISIKTLAKVACLSPFHFIRVFHKQVGMSPHGYLMQTRIMKARALLAKGRKIAAVAHETGFSDQSHLTRRFKRSMGFTPGQYRNSVQDS